MIFSTHKDFLQGWGDAAQGKSAASASVLNLQMWQDGFNANKKYSITEEDELALIELTNVD